LCAAALIALAICGNYATAAEAALPIIERHRIGVVAIGIDADKVYDAFRPEERRLVDLALEGFLSPALQLRPPGTTKPDAIVAELAARNNQLVIWRIQVNDSKLRTAKGIHVGSTVSDLRAAYRVTSVLEGEEGVFLRVDQLSASFSLDQSGADRARISQGTAPELIPASVKIRSILLTQ